ncbi:unnamed protein product [Clavelina lepadiformis]|uniref:Uncharacterized protein n=1 Tax=Clavelina lepadiformis TaxID=159417 RepID=A0ABP0G059_CLALP
MYADYASRVCGPCSHLPKVLILPEQKLPHHHKMSKIYQLQLFIPACWNRSFGHPTRSGQQERTIQSNTRPESHAIWVRGSPTTTKIKKKLLIQHTSLRRSRRGNRNKVVEETVERLTPKPDVNIEPAEMLAREN